MNRRWFQDKDGSYYRNIPTIDAERHLLINRILPWRRHSLNREINRALSEGLIVSHKIGRRDEIVMPRSFRSSYPNHPGLWVLDKPRKA